MNVKHCVFLSVLSYFSVCLNAQTISLKADAEKVCEGQDVNLTVDYGECTSLTWEYTTDGVSYYTFDKSLKKENTYQIDESTCFRVKGDLNGQTVLSNGLCVNVEYIHKPSWSYEGNTIPSGYVIDLCPGYLFEYNIPDAKDLAADYLSEWLIDGEKVNNDFNTVLGPYDDDCKVTNIITSKGVCPPVVFDFNYRIEKPQEIKLSTPTPLVCNGSEAILEATFEKTPAEVYWREGASRVISDKNTDRLVFNVDEVGLYNVVAVSELGCVNESDYVIIYVENEYRPKWKDWPGRACVDGTTISKCAPFEVDFISLNEDQFKNSHKAQWLLNGVEFSTDFSTVSPSIYEAGTITHVVTGKVCPPVRFDYEVIPLPTPKLELSVLDKSCDGEVTFNINQKDGDYGIVLHSKKESATQENPTEVLDSKEAQFIWKKKLDEETKYWLSSCYEFEGLEGIDYCCSTSDTISVSADITEELEINVVNWRGEEDGKFTWETKNYVNRCYPEEFKTKVNVVKGNPTSYVWKRDGQVVSTSYSLIEPTRPVQAEYTVEVSDGCHDITKKFWLTPSFIDSLKLLASNTEVCEGDSVTIILDKDSRKEMWLYEVFGPGRYNKYQFLTDTLIIYPKENAFYWAYDDVIRGCGRKSDTVFMNVNKTDLQIELNKDMKETLCYGDEFEADVNVLKGNPLSYEWRKNGNLLSSGKHLLDIPTETENVYTLVVSDDKCKRTKKVQVSVSPLTQCELFALKTSLCQSEETSLQLNQHGADVVRLYEQIGDDQNPKLISSDIFQVENVKPMQNVKYWAVASNQGCSIASDTVSILVKLKPEFEVSEFPKEICAGEEINASAILVNGVADIVKWIKIDKENDSGQVVAESMSLQDTPVSDATYVVQLENTECGSVKSEFDVIVHNPKVEVDDVTICEASSVALVAKGKIDQVYWYNDGNKDSLLNEGQYFNVSPTTTTTYHLVSKVGLCEYDANVTVNVNPLPVVTGYDELDNGRTYLFNVEGGTGKLLFDYGKGGIPMESNILRNPFGDMYHIKVTDELGCNSTYDVKGIVFDFNIPDYFFANRETWRIDALSMLNGVTLRIYNRYGKLLVTTDAPEKGWDGTYNGYDMPSTDYWYVLDIEELDIQRSGHFTLLRE